MCSPNMSYQTNPLLSVVLHMGDNIIVEHKHFLMILHKLKMYYWLDLEAKTTQRIHIFSTLVTTKHFSAELYIVNIHVDF